ncbi:HNH endonuclease [Actinoallomurus sp. NBC_01490]|uniref:HNH endonuclease signature motif containing protein n=1 Tax=Actinoallomurus sp. NBC_01490 TaxID=2903557 RepID=UPI002E305CFD|nr:DUF222 domain-containing protein [Actinoallomurus sp. NBC_01490]
MSAVTRISLFPQISPEDSFGFDAGELSDHDLAEAMVEARRLASRVQAVELAAVAELARRRFAEAEDRDPVVEVLSPAEYVFDEVAEALTLTSTAAGGLIRFATELTGQLPATFAALAAGQIDYLKARTIWHTIDQVDEESARIIEAKVLAKAPEQTTGQIRAKIRRLIKQLDPEAADRRRQEAEKHRGVELIETQDGTVQLSGVDLPSDAASAAYGRISAIATGLKRDGDDRKIDQLRADVFLGLLRGTFTTSEPPADTTDRPTSTPATGEPGWTSVDDAIAEVIADAARTELTTLTHALGAPRQGIRRDITGVGELIAQTATHTSRSRADDIGGLIFAAGARIDRSLVEGFVPGRPDDLPERHHGIGDLIAQAGARINRCLVELRSRWCVPGPVPRLTFGPAAGADPGAGGGPGRPPDPGGKAPSTHGVPRYRPPAAMRHLIEHRDRRCCFPGCRRPVRHCDADHTVPFHRGGATCICNIALLCRRHHRVKQSADWRIEHLWPGVILWIGPTGHWKITAPADRE